MGRMGVLGVLRVLGVVWVEGDAYSLSGVAPVSPGLLVLLDLQEDPCS